MAAKAILAFAKSHKMIKAIILLAFAAILAAKVVKRLFNNAIVK